MADSNIKTIRTLISDQIEIEKKEVALTILADIELIHHIHDLFLQILPDNQFKEGSVLLRKLFIFVTLMLYSPGTVFREKRMPEGLRHKIAETLHVLSDHRISDYTGHVRFLYLHYADFRDQADYLYSEILFRLEIDKHKL